jgi:hypothetical protein
MSDMNWKQAFRRQAESDYDVFVLLNNIDNLPVSHSLHYLQMTSEKIAKSFQCEANERPKLKHSVVKKFVVSLKTTPAVRNYLGYKDKNEAFSNFIRTMSSVADRIEKLAPSGQDVSAPNSEYPWQSRENPLEVVAPVDYSFKEYMIEYNKYEKFIEKMLKYEQ